ncbi:ribonuclease HII [Desulfosporosinus sp. FKA]|uniref:ribonuclease HII n=1 Tax=Desulfosporosinus sp. FKA TaxID=1969834 RepID=UPI000B4A1C1E|nr:ribonuclease HII [Desulfosporosinus sp. FKA]
MHDNSEEHWIMLRQDEQECWNQGYTHVMGCDEVGRGALAGPCVSGGVILNPDFCLMDLRDSKEATPKMRRTWTEIIKEQAISWSIGQAEASEIDTINIHKATLTAMSRAIRSSAVKPDYILIDGKFITTEKIPQKAIIQGDVKSAVIAAASIVAKVYRDELMMEYAKVYPEYEFDQNKGYPTKKHMDVIRRIGPCPIHRKSYLKFLEKGRQMDIFDILVDVKENG